MNTKFAKFEGDFPKAWMKFSGAAAEWLDAYHVVYENNGSGDTWGVFYVKPTILALALEMFAKSLAAHEDAAFNGMKFRHNTSKVIFNYRETIKLFKKISDNRELMRIICEYEKTVDVKYGGMGVNIDGDEEKMLLDVIYEIRAEMYARTNVNYLR